jgi:hypothetical protein
MWDGVARFSSEGKIDASFRPPSSVGGAGINSIAVQPDGNILVAGYFSNLGGAARAHVARLFGGSLSDYTLRSELGPANAPLVLTWSNPEFSLEAASNAAGTYQHILGAASPYTNRFTNSQQFFRLRREF